MVRRTCSEKSGGAPPTFARRYVALAFGFGLILGGPGINPAHAQQTVVSIQQQRFLLNGVVTHKGTAAEGLLLNSRMIQAIFDDENSQTVGKSAYPDTGVWDAERNVQEFIAALPSYKAKGLRAFTVGLQGGSPGWATGNTQPNITSAFRSDGTLKGAWLNRLDRVIRAADQQGIVVIVSLFYFGQDHRLANETAVIRAVDGMTDWLLPYTNVLLEINNEADVLYDHAILRPQRVSELITRVKQRSQGLLKVSTSLQGGSIPSSTIISASDYVLLHGNGRTASQVAAMVDTVRGMAAYQAHPKPIVFNEDSTTVANLDAAVNKRGSWGYYDQGTNNYRDGYQSPPVNWTINTNAKRAFFDRVAVLTAAGSAPSDSTTMRVGSFTLINADTDQPISGFDVLTGGEVTLNLAQLPTRNLNLRAHTSPTLVGSVRFGVNGNASYLIENAAPYALAGDTNGDYAPWTLGLGSHMVTATPYTGSNASGSAGAALSVTLKIVDSVSAAPLYRVNAGGLAVSSTPGWSADTKSAPSPYVNAGAAGNGTYATSTVINLGHSSLPAGIPGSLFQTERYDPSVGVDMQWSFPVTPGTYEVRLYFAEIYFTAANRRVFDVLVENKAVLSRYDIVAEVGAFKGVMKSFIVASDASLDIRFGRIIDSPKISAIEIIAR